MLPGPGLGCDQNRDILGNSMREKMMSPLFHSVPATLSLILLSACVTSVNSPTQSSTSAFDGEYMHVRTLDRVLSSGAGFCSSSNLIFVVQIRDGQFSTLYNADQRVYLIGNVLSDGSIRAQGQLRSGQVNFLGQITDGRFRGVATSPNCVYSFVQT